MPFLKKEKKSLIIILLLLAFLISVVLSLYYYYNFGFGKNFLKPEVESNELKLNIMLSQANLPVVSLTFLEKEAVASLSGDIKVIFSLDKNLAEQVASLQLILERFRIEGRKVKLIDLRFNNPIVE